MAFLWRRRKTSLKTNLNTKNGSERMAAAVDVSVPLHFRCPISLDLMHDPVTAPTGITYDRQSIESWLELGHPKCPVTKQAIGTDDLVPNHSLRKLIQDWCVAHRSHGIERIPTPKIPVSRARAEEMAAEIAVAGRDLDCACCARMAAMIKKLAKEGERNRRCLTVNGTGRALAGAFASFAVAGGECDTSSNILSTLAMLLPLDEAAQADLRSPESLRSLVSLLNHRDRISAALVAKELVASGGATVVGKTEGMVEALAKIIKERNSSAATKASLVAVFYIVSSSERAAERAVELGLVEALVEMLADAEKSECEKALAVLDALVGSEGGGERARGHALTVPALVKKMFRVSDAATELAVSAMWKVCGVGGGGEREDGGRGRCLVEALQAGAFQKLLLLLQVGCGEGTKERATDLLRLLNGSSRGRDECIDTMDFMGVRRSV